jgi:hypothetical protein
MPARVLHQPRVAWDGARVLVNACATGYDFGKLSVRVRELLGPAYEEALWQSQMEVRYSTRPDAPELEAGKWRVRLEDVLRERPELIEVLAEVFADAKARAVEGPGI